VPERFELERTQFRAHHEDTPLRMLLLVAAAPIPNLKNIRDYQQTLNKLARDAESANHLPEAMQYYWTTAHMGERMQLSPGFLIDQLIGTALQRDSYILLAALYHKQGQNEIAASLASLADQLKFMRAVQSGRNDILAASSNSGWAFFVLLMLSTVITTFVAITGVAILYVNAKRWVRPEKKGRLYSLMTTAENYMPLVLFFACAALYMTYYPYWVNYQHYMTASGGMHDFEAFLRNTIPEPGHWTDALDFGNPFKPYCWYVLAGVVLVVSLHLATRGKKAQAEAKGAGAS
jgi:hypothetical protein